MTSSLPKVLCRAKIIAFSAAAAASVTTALLAAPRSIAQPDNDIQVTTNIHGNPATRDTHQCEKVKGVDGLPFINTSTVGLQPGDNWHGQATDVSCLYPQPDGSSYITGTETGTITIDGCGTGSAVLDFEGTISAPGADGNRTDQETAHLEAGKETVDLKDVSGSFTSQGTSYSDGSGDEVLTGTAHCHTEQ